MSIISLVKFIIINFICIILNFVAILIGAAIVSFSIQFFCIQKWNWFYMLILQSRNSLNSFSTSKRLKNVSLEFSTYVII